MEHYDNLNLSGCSAYRSLLIDCLIGSINFAFCTLRFLLLENKILLGPKLETFSMRVPGSTVPTVQNVLHLLMECPLFHMKEERSIEGVDKI